MSDFKKDSSPSKEQKPESVDSKKTGLFDYLNKPITLSFKSKDSESHQVGSDVHSAQERPMLKRLKKGLMKTRAVLFSDVGDLLRGKKTIDDEVLEELETRLLLADVGVEATQLIIEGLSESISLQQLVDVEALLQALQIKTFKILEPCSQPLRIAPNHRPFIILMVGVNGVGKTTTIGKLAQYFQDQGLSVMLAAGDTFRAAAVEQLQVWGERNQIPVIAQQLGADSASVIFDATQAAQARNIDVLIADTAGRLHTQSNLMDELKKIKRVIGKLDDTAPHEIMLVVDAGTGQNALNQAVQFHEAVGLSGITLTKLDGTAKGGIILAIANRLRVPIRFIGIGEDIQDLREFNAEEFVTALLNSANSDSG